MKMHTLSKILIVSTLIPFYADANPFKNYLKKSIAGLGLVVAGYVLYSEFRFFKAKDHWEAVNSSREWYFTQILVNNYWPKRSPVSLAEEYNFLKKLEAEMKERKKTALITRFLETFDTYIKPQKLKKKKAVA